MVKINEVCLKQVVAYTSPGRADSITAFIDVSELDFKIATGNRAASMDHIAAKRRVA